MIIISWDVGIIHLAYCVLKYENDKIEIIDWDDLNLIEDDIIKIECCGKNKKGKICNKNASYYIKYKNDTYGYCKSHLKQSEEYWTKEKVINLFKEVNENTCCYEKKNKCKTKAKYVLNKNIYYCSQHYKMILKNMIKESSPQLIKNMISRKYDTSKLQLNLINKLDKLIKHFAKLNIEQVIIENQPSQKNPKMKSIANTLFDYFMIRGYVDKIHGINIKLVKFICPSNKLKVNNDNTIEVFKNNKDKKQKYKLTKELGIIYTKKLLENDPLQLEYLNLFKKKDDLCDSFLQGCYYLKILI